MEDFLTIYEFMALSDKDKAGYFLRCYPYADPKNRDFVIFDFEVFIPNQSEDVRYHGDWQCECCERTLYKGYGSSDQREPYFCENCFIETNLTSEFFKD